MMKDRKPYKIDKLMQVYNAFQVVVCSWVLVEVSMFSWIF